MNVSKESKAKGLEVRKALGAKPQLGSPALALVPELEEWIVGAIFGDIWGRPQLDLKTRCAMTMTMMAVLGHERPLRGQINYALNLGWTQEQICEVFIHVIPYGGLNAGVGALRVAQEVFRERDPAP